MKTLLLIDGHAMIHRAFHALPLLATKDGFITNAIRGFFMMTHKIICDFHPTHVIVCFDTPKPTFRKELFKDYQAKRPPMIDGLKPQIPVIKTILDKAHVMRMEQEGFEADDLIGTFATRFKNEMDRVLILTGDRDILQLVDKNIFVVMPVTGVSNVKLYTPDEVKLKFGIEPKQIPDYKSLAGDASDNYNTAKGIGPKTATGLLTQFGTIENMFEHINEIEKERVRNTIIEYKDTIILFKQIATIIKDMDVEMTLKQAEFHGFNEEAKDELEKLELFSLRQTLFNIPKPVEEKVIKPKAEPKKEDNADQIGLF